jgi:L-ascorbate metabolism protein UlaG (beta-lactamase superfamily)
MDKIKLTQVVNAGLLIEGSGRKILIDGIHNVKTPEWSTVDNNLMNYIIYGKGRFKDINYLLFTHQHEDHFNIEKTLEYMENNKVEKLVATKLNSAVLKNSGILHELDGNYYELGTINPENILIKYIRTKHLSHERFGIDHYAFIIGINNKTILFSGDADYTKSEYAEALKSVRIDVIVAPFIMANSEFGRTFVRKVSPSLLILNHLPNKEDDEYNYTRMAERNVARHLNELPETIIFQNLFDEVIIE